MIERVAVFGSRALGRAWPSSDIDRVLHGPLDTATLSSIPMLLDLAA